MFQPTVSHDRRDADLDARLAWFRSLTAAQRMEWLAGLQEMAWEANGGRMPRKPDQAPIPGRCDVLELPETDTPTK